MHEIRFSTACPWLGRIRIIVNRKETRGGRAAGGKAELFRNTVAADRMVAMADQEEPTLAGSITNNVSDLGNDAVGAKIFLQAGCWVNPWVDRSDILRRYPAFHGGCNLPLRIDGTAQSLVYFDGPIGQLDVYRSREYRASGHLLVAEGQGNDAYALRYFIKRSQPGE